MNIAIYLIAIVLNYVLMLIVPLFYFMAFGQLVKYKIVQAPENPSVSLSYVGPLFVMSFIFIQFTEHLAQRIGYHLNWHFPLAVAILYFVMGSSKGANPASRSMNFSAFCGAIAYFFAKKILF